LLALLLVDLKLKLSARKLLLALALLSLLLAFSFCFFPCGFREHRKNALDSEHPVSPFSAL